MAQHHDAITGTEKQHVANDYHLRLHAAIENLAQTAGITFCPLLNISQCEVTENIEASSQEIIIYNPLGRVRSSLIRLPVVSAENWVVKDETGQVLVHQVTPLPEPVKRIPGRKSLAEYDLAFYADDLPPLGIKAFTIEKSNEFKEDSSLAKRTSLNVGDEIRVSVGNSELEIRATETGLEFTDLKNSFSNYFYPAFYHGHPGNNSEFEFRASGAYIFRPLEQEPELCKSEDSESFQGPLFQEIHFNFQNNVSFVTRNVRDRLELEWLVGPISVEDGLGREFVNVWKSVDSFDQNGVFFTDANGRQTMKRIRDFRPSYNPENATLEEPVSSNYYPVNSAIYIRDQTTNVHMAVLSDRAQGASSVRDGEIEVMTHRRLLDDDAFGVGEALNEEAYGTGLIVRGKHLTCIGFDADQSSAQRRILSNEIFAAPIIFFPTPIGPPPPISQLSFPKGNQGVYELPPNVNLLTLEPWLDWSTGGFPSKQFLVRLEHLFEEGEHSSYSQPVTISLSDFFGSAGLGIGELSFMRETTLGGNRWKDEVRRFDWKLKDGGEAVEADKTPEATGTDEATGAFDVTLGPMQIRTFVVEFLSV